MAANQAQLILTMAHVNKTFPGVKALDDVSIEIKKGEVHGIVGENGAGKSTLMKILSGVYTKDSGTIVFDGETVEHTTPIESLNRGMSIIYQEFNLVETMSVGENIFMGRFREAGGMRGTHKRAKELLDSIGSKINTHTLVKNLSTSQKQMVEIAKALSFQSKLIIMDEPSSSLTVDELKTLFALVKKLVAGGISVIYISHKLDEIFELCDTVTIMRDGHVIDTKPVSALTRSDMITKMVGREITNEYPERPHCVGETLLEVTNLNSHKLHDVSLTVNKGEILGLVGLVGAGRTEIIRAIFGADRVRSIHMTLEGKPITVSSPARRHQARHGPGPGGPQAAGPGAPLLGRRQHQHGHAAGHLHGRVPDRRPREGKGRGRARGARSCSSRRPAARRRSSPSPAATSRSASWAAGWRCTRSC
jgi:ribose transport system ATP-binding protein